MKEVVEETLAGDRALREMRLEQTTRPEFVCTLTFILFVCLCVC